METKWIRCGDALRKLGIDVAAETKRKALQLISGDAAYVVHGTFNPEATLQIFNDAIEQAYTDGFTGFRAAAEMSWALDCLDGPHQVIVYEALLKSLFANCRAIGFCLYDRKRMPLEVLNGALLTHPIAGAHGHYSANPFYDPATTRPTSIEPADVLENSRGLIVRVPFPDLESLSRRIGAPAFGCGTSQPRARCRETWRLELGRSD